jgi:hypothetical protein
MPARELALDLDCDGRTDSLRVRWERVDGIDRPVFRLSGSLRGHLVATGDELPKFVGIGDVNGDGTLDVLLEESDESSVSANVLLVRGATLALATYESPGLREEATYVFHDVGWRSQCLDTLRPRIVGEADGRVVIDVATGGYNGPGDCDQPRRMRMWVLRDTLRVAP